MAQAGGTRRDVKRLRGTTKGTRQVAGASSLATSFATRWSAVALISGALAMGASPSIANPGDGQGGQGGYVDPANPGTGYTDPGNGQGTGYTDPGNGQGTGYVDPANPGNGNGNGNGNGGWTEPVAPGAVEPAPTEPAPVDVAPAGSTFAPVWIDPAVVPEPPENEALPTEVDVRGEFAQQISCDPLDRPGVTAFALLVSEHYGRPHFTGARPCIDYASFHHDGRALDWPLAAWDTNDRMIADAVVVWLTDNDGEMAKRFGIEYLIWNYQIWYADGRGWSSYDGHPHDDHIHFSFTWDGAQMRTSWWTGVAVTQPDLGPCAVSASVFAPIHQWPRFVSCETLQLSSVIPDPALAVASLAAGVGLTPGDMAPGDVAPGAAAPGGPLAGGLTTGAPTDATGATGEVLATPGAQAGIGALDEAHRWQATEFTPHKRTTVTQGDTGEAVKVLQAALGVDGDGDFGPKTAEALTAWEESVPALALQAARRGEALPAVTPLTWTYLERAAHPTIVLRDHELAIGDVDQAADPEGQMATASLAAGDTEPAYQGGAVTFLQTLLGLDADGSFGPKTQEAVMAVQRDAELEPTGIVDPATWAAVETVALEEGRVEGAPGSPAAREAKEKAAKKAEEQAAEKKEAKEKAEKKKAEAVKQAKREPHEVSVSLAR